MAAVDETRGWDDTRPPQLELIDDCVHCGLSLIHI